MSCNLAFKEASQQAIEFSQQQKKKLDQISRNWDNLEQNQTKILESQINAINDKERRN